jgi:hypothetical protein
LRSVLSKSLVPVAVAVRPLLIRDYLRKHSRPKLQ